MKIILLCIGDIRQFPPALSIWATFEKLGYQVKVFTDNSIPNQPFNSPDVLDARVNYYKKRNLFCKLVLYFRVRKKINDFIETNYNDNNTLIWVVGNDTLKYLNPVFEGKNYILHFLELTNKICFLAKLPFLKVNIKKYCLEARKIIACEANRAYFMMAQWGLPMRPLVIPNKPYIVTDFVKNNKISDLYANKVIKEIGNKKIILYQGVLSKERPLDQFIQAVEALGENYAFVVLSQSEDIYGKKYSKNYYYIPYVAAPFHLEITSYAYIGIVIYIPMGNMFHSLNALYCAPNKIYEYSMFGIPMIGNDIPGLITPFSQYNCGKCIKDISSKNIYDAIKEIEGNYNELVINSKKMYNATNIMEIIEKEVLCEI